ncbi:hypothetical protein OF385_02575 [Glutamicibacter sp. JL.03c]|uniref:hypothetical protein n=1 Tax=Glutamicibacter sp. JL.03c TaxID=2984842 RepID=UPI0021F7BA11|nr:hypothetical protein [Glutamicibacter sp. JL.03c]UYQ78074.1 hypothetical protein OF385_02575 [Glutamicibacter sp. JL.03c]
MPEGLTSAPAEPLPRTSRYRQATNVGLMEHTYNMISQVLVRQPNGDSPALRIYPVDSTASELMKEGRRLGLGSQDLIRFAGYAKKHGFRITSFSVSDARLNPLPQDDAESTSDSMLQVFNELGVRGLNAAMEFEFDGLYIVGVELRSPKNGLTIDLRRHGYIDTSIPKDAENLIGSAWRELRLA